jgi:hypothetical protein
VRTKRIAALVTIIGLAISGAAVAAGNDEKPMASAEKLTITVPISATYVPATPAKRPTILPVLYATLGAMQAFDLYSTAAALKAGAHETNPMAAAYAGNTASMLALKATTTAGTIFFAERLWKKNRVGAIVLMAAINGATAAVSMRNMRNARVAAGR